MKKNIYIIGLIFFVVIIISGCFGSTGTLDLVNRILTGQGGDTQAQWTPGGWGDKIVFVSDRTGTAQVYIMKNDGTGQTQLTNTVGGNSSPAFTPDGRILFRSIRDGDSEIYIMNIDGTNQTRISNDPSFDGYPTSWPDGSKILFHSERHAGGIRNVYSMRFDGSNVTDITNSPLWTLLPSINPAGTKIAYSEDIVEPNPPPNFYRNIWTMNPDGTGKTQITVGVGDYNSAPYYSPDGTKICFVSNRDGNNEIYVMNADGTNQTRLTNDPSNDNFTRYMPSGKIAFSSDRSGAFQIYTINPDGTGLTQLTNANPGNWIWQ